MKSRNTVIRQKKANLGTDELNKIPSTQQLNGTRGTLFHLCERF